MNTIRTTFKLRRGTAAEWTSANPILAVGEPGIETDTKFVKYGDGSTAWNDLPYPAANPDVATLDDLTAEETARIAGDSARPTSVTLAASGGAALIGSSSGTVQDSLDAKLPKSGGALTGGLTFGNSNDAVLVGDGTRTVNGGAVVVVRNLTGQTANRYAFNDNTTFSADAGLSYASFDANMQISSVNNMDHYNGFQTRAPVNMPGKTLTRWRGVSINPTLTDGTITNLYGIQMVAPTVTAGTITTQYGIHIAGLIEAGTNWAIYTAGPTESYFGGALTVSGFKTDSAAANQITITGFKAFTYANVSTAMVRIGDVDTGGSLFVRTPSLSTSFSSGLGVDGSYDSGTRVSTVRLGAYGVRSASNTYGSALVFGTTNQTTYTDHMTLDKNGRLDLNGPFGFRPSASVTPANNGDLEIEATNDTTLTFKFKGSDGVVRSGTITLA